MKAYYYFLFRIYRLYKDKNKESDSQALFSATAVSTTIISINLFSLYGIADYFDVVTALENKYYAMFIMVIIGCINHYFFVREKKFLNYDFRKDRKGGYLIVLYIILSALFAFTEGQYNREKIFHERAGKISTEPRKESLEGKLRKLFE
jgi:amino acid transporter